MIQDWIGEGFLGKKNDVFISRLAFSQCDQTKTDPGIDVSINLKQNALVWPRWVTKRRQESEKQETKQNVQTVRSWGGSGFIMPPTLQA